MHIEHLVSGHRLLFFFPSATALQLGSSAHPVSIGMCYFMSAATSLSVTRTAKIILHLLKCMYQFTYFLSWGATGTQQTGSPVPCIHTVNSCASCTGFADGIEEQGGSIMYKANVRNILTEGDGDKLKAVGVRLADGRIYPGQVDSVHIALLGQSLQVCLSGMTCLCMLSQQQGSFTL